MLRFVLAIACLVFTVAEARIQVHTTPDLIIPGVTQFMTVSCNINDYQNHGLTDINRIEVAFCKNKACVKDDLLLLAEVYDQPEAVKVNRYNLPNGFNKHSEATGDVASQRSFLTLVWKVLESDHTGRYKCIFHGKTRAGYQTVLWDFVDVVKINQREVLEGAVPEEPKTSV